MLIIGDRINAARKYIAQAVLTENRVFIQSEAKEQANFGADYINLNATIFGDNESKLLSWMIEVVQEVTDVPLCIDTPNPEVIRNVLPLIKKKPMINSITLEEGRKDAVFPLVIERGAKVIASCQADQLTAQTAEEKFDIAKSLIRVVTGAGIPVDDLYIDPLVYSLSTNPFATRATLDAIGKIMTSFHGVHTICCPSSASYGLPSRNLLQRTFLVAAMERGLDSAIIDTADAELAEVILAGRLISGREKDCLRFIRAFRDGKIR